MRSTPIKPVWPTPALGTRALTPIRNKPSHVTKPSLCSKQSSLSRLGLSSRISCGGLFGALGMYCAQEMIILTGRTLAATISLRPGRSEVQRILLRKRKRKRRISRSRDGFQLLLQATWLHPRLRIHPSLHSQQMRPQNSSFAGLFLFIDTLQLIWLRVCHGVLQGSD
jgi:hypothetical protein